LPWLEKPVAPLQELNLKHNAQRFTAITNIEPASPQQAKNYFHVALGSKISEKEGIPVKAGRDVEPYHADLKHGKDGSIIVYNVAKKGTGFSGNIEKNVPFYFGEGDSIRLGGKTIPRDQRIGLHTNPEFIQRYKALKPGESFTVGREAGFRISGKFVSRLHAVVGKDAQGRLYINLCC
jgi:hypothetical protein